MTTSHFWDCECEFNYIHPKSQRTCTLCNTVSDEQPDSIVEEVKMTTLDQPTYKTAKGYQCLVLGYESHSTVRLHRTAMRCPFCDELGVYLVPNKETRRCTCYCGYCDISYKWRKEE